MITAEKLREFLEYDPNTGVFRWRFPRVGVRRDRNSIAGTVSKKDGYRIIQINGNLGKAHRLAWLYVHGRWPANQIDHINGIRDDNRITNLREATNAENARNAKRLRSNKSGYKGVYWHKSNRRWIAQVNIDGRCSHLGSFGTAEAAHAAYCDAATKHYGEFARLDTQPIDTPWNPTHDR